MITSFSKVLPVGLCAFGISMAALVGTGCSGAQEVHHTGGMSQEMQVGISPDLVEKITGLFDTIFGRKPSDDETAQAAEFLAANGDDLELLRDSLAHSAEARQQIQNLLSEAFGQQVDGATVDLWISALADNLSLDQIRDLLNEI